MLIYGRMHWVWRALIALITSLCKGRHDRRKLMSVLFKSKADALMKKGEDLQTLRRDRDKTDYAACQVKGRGRACTFLRRPLRRAIKHLSETRFSQSTHKVCKAPNSPLPCPLAAFRPSGYRACSCGKKRARFHFFFFLNFLFFFLEQSGKNLIPLSFQINSPDFCKLFHVNMMHQLLLVLLCASCGASALGTSIPAVSTLNFTGLGAAQRYRTDTTAKIRKRRYISQNDMLAILDYHNKVRGRVFPPASNMEYMVSERFFSPSFPKLCSSSSSCWFTLASA